MASWNCGGGDAGGDGDSGCGKATVATAAAAPTVLGQATSQGCP